MVKRNKYEIYYAVRETCPQPYYDVQIDMNNTRTKEIVDYVKKHPEALARTVVIIYSSGEPCELKLYDTVEACLQGIKDVHELEQSYRFSATFERVIRIRKNIKTITEENSVIADVQFPN
jgi:hypothetical protein